jgi:hypothetical protein
VNPRPAPRALTPDELREHGLQVATRMVAVQRMGRAYPVGNPAFTGQLEQLLDVLAPVLAACGDARLTHADGDLLLNDVTLPTRASSARFTEQLVHELRVRGIDGVRFARGIDLAELELFMRYFLPSEVYRGPDLERACLSQGLKHALPLLWDAPAALPAESAHAIPSTYQDALDACARANHDAQWMLGAGLPRGVATHRYQRIVQPLVDSALAGDALSAGLADLDHASAPAWMHGMHVCLLTILVGRALGLGRATLAELGVAALVHGADGLAPAPDTDPASLALLRRARLAPLDPPMLTALLAALPPSGESGDATPAVHVLRIADCWVSLAEHRANRAPRYSPHEALGVVLGPLAGRFHPAVRTALVRAIGLYPPGQIVELDDGSVARACAADPREPARPLLERMTGAGSQRLDPALRGRVQALPAERSIVRAVPFARRETAKGARDASAA